MKKLIAALSLTLLTSPLAAQEFYAGVGYDYGMPHSGADQTLTSIFGGARFGTGQVTYGGELDYGLSIGSATDHDSLRLRGIVHNDAGALGFFGTLGLAQYDLDVGSNATGVTYGLGVDYGLTQKTGLRVEVIRDNMIDYGTNVTTVRAGVMYSF